MTSRGSDRSANSAPTIEDADVRDAKRRLPWLDELCPPPWPAAVHPSVDDAASCELLPPGPQFERITLDSLNVEAILIGTNHLQPFVAAAAERLINELQPHAVMVELCMDRFYCVEEALERYADECRSAAASHNANQAERHGQGDPVSWLTASVSGTTRSTASASHAASSINAYAWLLPKKTSEMRDVLRVGLNGAALVAAERLTEHFIMELLQADMSDYGGDMTRSTTAAVRGGVMLFLGDRASSTTRIREACELTSATRKPLGLSCADALNLVHNAVMVLTGNWPGVAEKLLHDHASQRAAAFAEGWECAKLCAANPQLDALSTVLVAALAEIIRRGDDVADPKDVAAARTVERRAAVHIASGGRRALKDAALLHADAWLKVPDGERLFLDSLGRVPDDSDSARDFNHSVSPESCDATEMQAVRELLEPDGRLRPQRASAAGSPELARARRIAAGAGYLADSSGARRMAVLIERDAILASSILHMRDGMEQAAAEKALLHWNRVTGGITRVGSPGRRAAASELVDDWDSPTCSPLADKPLRLVAVVGAGHVPGVRRYLRSADTLASQASEYLDSYGPQLARDAGKPAFDVAAAHAELVRQGFLPAKTLFRLRLKDICRGQPQADVPSAGARTETSPAGAAIAPMTTATASAQTHIRPAENELESSIGRRALVRAVAACALDEQIAPTLTTDPGLMFQLRHTAAPLAAATACVVLPFIRKAPRPLRIAAGAVTLTTVAGAGAVAAAAVKLYRRLESALDAADKRR